MKAKLFMIQYFNYQTDKIWNNQDMDEKIKIAMIRKMTHAISAYENGLCTVDETMAIINRPGAGIVD